MGDNAIATPRALRSVISLIGCRNAGKSSLLNAITGQNVSIVSEQAGTTTDVVAKPYELLPFGPVTFYDTAGLDDDGELGALRIKATQKAINRSDVVMVVCGESGIGEDERKIIAYIKQLKIPFLLVFNKIDCRGASVEEKNFCQTENIKYVEVSAVNNKNIDTLKTMLVEQIPEELKKEPLLAGDLFSARDTVVLVVPIDLEAPKGRLILPQVQVLREVLDNNAIGIVCKETDLEQTLTNQKIRPKLVITDSQVIKKVTQIVPQEINLTTFSILFARNKGDLSEMVAGARMIDNLQDNDKVLIAEACSHHIQCDDIGRVKLPRLLTNYTGKNLVFDFCSGNDFPDNLEEYKLVVHCGACMLNRVEMLRRLHECVRRGLPITNYGVAISKTQGVLDRVLSPFEL